MSSVIARSGSPPPPRTVDEDNNDNYNHDADHGQEETDNIQPTTSTAATATQQGSHHYREQDQGGLGSEADEDEVVDEGDYENEDDVDWGDDADDDDVYEEEPDPVYVADLLRESRIDWMQYPEYATHRLVVTSTEETTGAAGQVPGRQYYRVMAQFLVPGSAVFRDFLLGEDPNIATNDEDEEEDEEEQEFRRKRLACLHDEPFTDSTLANNTRFQDPSNAPVNAHSLLEPLEPYIDQRYAPYTPLNLSQENTDITDTDPCAHQPWIHLSLDHPEHFPGLLQAMYTMDLRTWEETCFRPEMIVGIIETVRRLECCSGLMVKCLEYFRRVEGILGAEEFDKQSDEEGKRGLEEVGRLLRAAVDGGMLPPDPEL
ncbi:hypothetical protein BGZ47_006528 [Haplosporangium gracile]|nr:hypothetical protein BGZ47_006528 [Haplosporangium gracile]